ncbi:MAG: ACT domain-containing protein [Clostridia bacterium]
MADVAGLSRLGELVHRFEDQVDGAVLTILAHEDRHEIAAALTAGLRGNVQVQHSSGEYTNHLAVLKVGSQKYTFARDYRETYISEIGYTACRITPGSHGVLVYHLDYPGVIYDVSNILAQNQINISKLNVSREQKGKTALLVSITDEEIKTDVIAALERLPQVTKVLSFR